MNQPLDPDIHEYFSVLEEEQDILAKANEKPVVPNTPKFLALRVCTALRENLDLRTVDIMAGDTTRIITSNQGPWYWLLLDITNPTQASIERLKWAAEGEELADPPPGLWAMGTPVANLWKRP